MAPIPSGWNEKAANRRMRGQQIGARIQESSTASGSKGYVGVYTAHQRMRHQLAQETIGLCRRVTLVAVCSGA